MRASERFSRSLKLGLIRLLLQPECEASRYLNLQMRLLHHSQGGNGLSENLCVSAILDLD